MNKLWLIILTSAFSMACGAGEVKFPDGKTRTVEPGEFIALN